MSKPLSSSGNLSGSAQARLSTGHGHSDDAPKQDHQEAHARPAGQGPSDRQRTARGGSVPAVSRSPQTRQSLAKLRRELARIDPPPANPEEALAEIAEALTRANLADWAAPLLSEDNRSRGADDTLVIRLLAHEITLEPTGAFRIVDLHPPKAIYFSMPGRDKARRPATSTRR